MLKENEFLQHEPDFLGAEELLKRSLIRKKLKKKINTSGNEGSREI